MYNRIGKMVGDKFKVDISNSENYSKEDSLRILNALEGNKTNLNAQRKAYQEALVKMDEDEKKIDSDIAFFKERVPNHWLKELASANADGKGKTK